MQLRTQPVVRAMPCALLIHWSLPLVEARAEAPGSNAPEVRAARGDLARATSTPYRPAAGGAEVAFNLEDANLGELTRHIATLTGKRFIFGPKLGNIGVSVVSPVKVSLAEAYEAFLCILQLNGLALVPQGQFLKIYVACSHARCRSARSSWIAISSSTPPGTPPPTTPARAVS
jgi:type II secretory pathway component GspD/PulD (secretin)